MRNQYKNQPIRGISLKSVGNIAKMRNNDKLLFFKNAII